MIEARYVYAYEGCICSKREIIVEVSMISNVLYSSALDVANGNFFIISLWKESEKKRFFTTCDCCKAFDPN